MHRYLKNSYNSIIDSAYTAGEQQLAHALYAVALQHKTLQHWCNSSGMLTSSSNTGSEGCLNLRYARPGTAAVAVQCALRELQAGAAVMDSDVNLVLITSERGRKRSDSHSTAVRQSLSHMLGEIGLECSTGGCEVTVPRSSLEAYLQQQTVRAADSAQLGMQLNSFSYHSTASLPSR
eukprot:14318-Heterococcus_DN1.PRE.1